MTWSTIRKATEEDIEKLEQRAQVFCERHDIEIMEGDTAVNAVEYATLADSSMSWEQEQEAKHLRPLWRRVVRRALGHSWAEGIAYGYVGFSVQ